VLVLALIAALALSGAGIVAFLAVIPAATLAQLLATALLTRGMRPLLPRFTVGQWRLLIGRTLPFAIATAVWVVYFRVAMIAISLISSPLQTGYFATSYRIIEVLIALPYVLVSTVFPVFARAAEERGARLARAADRVLAVALLVGVGLALTLALSAPTVVRLIAGSAGRPAARVLEIQAIALVPAFLGTTASFALFSLARYRSMLTAVSAGLMANLLLLPVLIDADAARGAAIATVAAEVAMAACLLVMLARALPGMRGPLRSAGPVSIAAAAGCAAALAAPLPPLGQAALAGAVYLGLLGALGVLPGDVGRALRGGAGVSQEGLRG
jgi:O-antigen/teichoic acid export membrane protein